MIYEKNDKNIFKHSITLAVDFEKLFEIEDWLKDSLGKYGERWIWYGSKFRDNSGFFNIRKIIYFISDTDALAFKLRFCESE